MGSNKTQHRKRNIFHVKMNILLKGFKTMFVATNGQVYQGSFIGGKKKVNCKEHELCQHLITIKAPSIIILPEHFHAANEQGQPLVHLRRLPGNVTTPRVSNETNSTEGRPSTSKAT